MSKCELILALDTDNRQEIDTLLEDLCPVLSWIKIGFQAFSILGYEGIQNLKDQFGYHIFLDLKFHDIPSTVARNIKTATKYGLQMINMHASGGFDMMRAARESANFSAVKEKTPCPILLGVTLLTSINERQFKLYFDS